MQLGKGLFKQLNPNFRLVIRTIREQRDPLIAWNMVINCYLLLHSVDEKVDDVLALFVSFFVFKY